MAAPIARACNVDSAGLDASLLIRIADPNASAALAGAAFRLCSGMLGMAGRLISLLTRAEPSNNARSGVVRFPADLRYRRSNPEHSPTVKRLFADAQLCGEFGGREIFVEQGLRLHRNAPLRTLR
jgi:hypothetical protein